MIIPVHQKIGGQDYVLVSHAEKHILGAADDAIRVVLLLVVSLRPDDKKLHADIAALRNTEDKAA